MHVGEAKVAAAETVGQLLVIEAQQMEHRRVEIINLALVLDGEVTDLVRGAVGGAAFHAAAGEPQAEAERIVVASVAALRERRAPELAAEDDECLVEKSALLEIRDKPREAVVHLMRHRAVAFLQLAVLIPRVRRVARADAFVKATQLDEAHAALDEPPREEALLPLSRALLVG